MEKHALRRIVVVDDPDIARALRNDELSEEELSDHIEDGSPVSYTLAVDADVDSAFVWSALGLDAGEENELTDSDVVATSWDPAAVSEALDELQERLENPESLASDLVTRALVEPDVEPLESSGDIVDILEQLDKGYEPEHDAHLAIGAAALLVRHVLAFRVARRTDAWVVAI